MPAMLAAVAAVFCALAPAQAQTYPVKTAHIRIE
jgi:hypothetical protein